MNKIVKSLVITSIFLIGLLFGMNINNKEVKHVIKESNSDYYIEEGEQIVEFTDGSYIVVDAGGNILE